MFCSRLHCSSLLATLLAIPSFSWAASNSTADSNNTVLEEVIVTATLRPQALVDVPSSVTVLDAKTLHDAGQQHFEDVLGLVPNLNWAAGTSRPRYFQIRGIGELDQYQGAPNPSVGFIVDDIDFSGLGGLATLFDVSQIEVLRDPQSTTYGANGLAGLIKVKTKDPLPQYELGGEVTAAQYDTGSFGAVIGGPLNIAGPDSAFRVVAQRYRSDGFRRNVFTGRDDANGLNELTTRGKLRFDLGEWQLALTGLYVDQDNGYDAWSIDNSFITRADYPGRDAQRSKAIAANLKYTGWSAATLESITTYSAVDQVYSFDDDWGNNPFWLATTGYSPYNYYSDITRTRTTRTQEFRLASKDVMPHAGRWGWVAGVYVRNLREDNSDVEFAQDVSYDSIGSASDLISRYAATNTAVYGQVEHDFTAVTTLAVGLRVERRDATYVDSDTPRIPSDENMVGGNLSLTHRWAATHSAHIELARGYKAGGVNIGAEVPSELRTFDAEYLWDLEFGDRGEWLDGKLSTDVSAFFMSRRNMQVSSSMQDPGNPAKFIFITDNAAHGENYGVESSATYRLASQWKVFGTASWLRARFIDYQYVDKYTGELHVLDGRAQAHAPSYQFSLGADWHHPSGWMGRVDVTGKGSFYFETSSNQTASAYQLVNAKLGYQHQQWAAYLWARNLLDKRYATRGFFFGNEPPDFTPKLYVQNGDPRQVGVTASWNF
jgi:iron complex outermembrane receptor protein